MYIDEGSDQNLNTNNMFPLYVSKLLPPDHCQESCADPEGRIGGPDPPPKNHKKYNAS